MSNLEEIRRINVDGVDYSIGASSGNSGGGNSDSSGDTVDIPGDPLKEFKVIVHRSIPLYPKAGSAYYFEDGIVKMRLGLGGFFASYYADTFPRYMTWGRQNQLYFYMWPGSDHSERPALIRIPKDYDIYMAPYLQKIRDRIFTEDDHAAVTEYFKSLMSKWVNRLKFNARTTSINFEVVLGKVLCVKKLGYYTRGEIPAFLYGPAIPMPIGKGRIPGGFQWYTRRRFSKYLASEEKYIHRCKYVRRKKNTGPDTKFYHHYPLKLVPLGRGKRKSINAYYFAKIMVQYRFEHTEDRLVQIG